MSMLILLTKMLSTMFLFLKHPMSMTTCLLLSTVMVSLITGLLFLNYWYSYILFMIMIGGMLVMLMYMTSVASNEKFSFNPLIIIPMMISSLISWNFHQFNQDKYNMESFLSIESSMSKFISWPNMLIYLSTISYLFVTLIVVVKISNINKGALRQKF